MTIYALATAPGRAALAVIRISGTAAAAALTALTQKPPPPPRRAVLRALYDPPSGRRIDEALVLWMPAPASFTGDDTAELHVHGGSAVVAGLLDALSRLPDLEPATAGAFTRRAVANGRLDLTRAEAIADLIDAESIAQQDQALRQMRGELEALYTGWRDRLTDMRAHVEAAIEFVEEDVPENAATSALAALPTLRDTIAAHLGDTRGLKLRDGLRLVLLGPPNVGKSSILNRLIDRDAAITAPQAGTTRDLIEAPAILGGVAITFVDTAGLQADTSDAVEHEGMRRAAREAENADLRLFVRAPDCPFDESLFPAARPDDIQIFNKSDLVPEKSPPMDDTLAISAATGAGFDALHARLKTTIEHRFAPAETPLLTRQRHAHSLREAVEALDRALAAQNKAPELVAEDLRLAARALGRVTGAVDVEAVLDVIFADFCIGK